MQAPPPPLLVSRKNLSQAAERKMDSIYYYIILCIVCVLYCGGGYAAIKVWRNNWNRYTQCHEIYTFIIVIARKLLYSWISNTCVSTSMDSCTH